MMTMCGCGSKKCPQCYGQIPVLKSSMEEDAIWQNIYNLCNQQNGESAFNVFKMYLETKRREAFIQGTQWERNTR